MLDRGFVAPGDFVDGDAEHSGDLLAFGRTGSPTAQGDGRDPAIIKAAAFGEFGDRELLLLAEVGDGLGHLIAPQRTLFNEVREARATFWPRLLASTSKLYTILAVSIIPIDGI